MSLSSPTQPLPTTHQRTPHPRAASSSSSPPSSRTGSLSSSPTTTTTITTHSHNHLFNLSPHRGTSSEHSTHTYLPKSTPQLQHCGVCILPQTTLRSRSSHRVLRRCPSAVEMALTEERCRCDGDAIERQGLDLMEPRPVDVNASVLESASASGHGHGHAQGGFCGYDGLDGRGSRQPRFVMGGIFEVMEGRA